jgi:hypothetical protein
MGSYYAVEARIRYYGQLPKNLERRQENGYDAAGKAVLIDTVVGGAAFSTEGVINEVDGNPTVVSDVRPIPSDSPIDLRRRREPVHEMLANLMLDSGSLYAFTKQWGFLEGEVDANTGTFRTRACHVMPLQKLLQEAWRGDRQTIENIAKDVTARIDVSPSGAEIAVLDLWSLIRILFLRDHGTGRTKVCANPDCSSPYFLQQRRGQKYCTHKCAVLMNVRRFREREAKAKSQSKKGAKR